MGIIFVGTRVGWELYVVTSGQDARERAVICQDCWFFKEMSCALANPENGVCANRRPVRGRAGKPKPSVQPPLIPLAAGHALTQPFSEATPEATFSMTALREPAADQRVPAATPLDVTQPVRSSPPSFHEIRSGRAAAAARVPVAEARIPIAELDEVQTRMNFANTEGSGLDELVERVRRRTAARLSGR